MPDPRAVGEDEIIGESRWPMAAAVVAAGILTVLLPDRWSLGPAWLLPACEAVLLVVLVLGDPGRINRRATALRVASIALVTVLAGSALWNTVHLIRELIVGGPAINSAGTLLSTGVTVWLCNTIAFSLLYWELDSGGAAARAHRLKPHPDFAFPQQLSPELAPPDWRPRFGDYMYLGFTNSIAFSPTDVMPLAMWAKGAMALESLVSLALLSLVIARAVNVF
jgi:hypothetical protein